MEIRCRCTGCQAKFKVDAKYAGKKARCPKCQAVVDVPLHASEESTTTLPPAPASKPGKTTTAIPVTKKAAAAPVPAAPAPPLPPLEPQAAIPTTAFPSFSTTPKPASAAGASASGPQPLARKKGSALPIALAGGALLIVAAVTAVGVMLATSGSGDGKAAKSGQSSVAQSKGTLYLDWPQSERSGGSIVIDGQRRAISSAGTLKYSLPPGEHKVRALRRGYEPFDATFTLAKGQETHIAPQWKDFNVAAPPATTQSPTASTPFPVPLKVSVAGFDGWLQMFEEAKEQAAEAKKDLLIVFGCSDDQQGTSELARNLDQAQVKQSHVCVILDFPDTTQGLDLVADIGQNQLLAQQFGVRSLPTLILADPQGRAYFLKREWNDGFGGMQAKLAEWSKSKAERDALLAAASQGLEAEQLAAAAKAVKWLQDKTVWRSHGEEIKAWLARAQKIDPENKQGVLEVFFEPQWFLELAQVNDEDATAVAQVAGQLDPWVQRKFQDPDRGAKLHMTAGMLLARVDRDDEALKQIEHAASYQPKDTHLAEALEGAKRGLANRGLLGTGSGFLISADGFILTNHHVIEGDGQVEVRLPQQTETLAAKVVASDAQRDMALLKVVLPAPDKWKPLPVVAGDIGLGDKIAAFGHPLGDLLGAGLKFTEGGVGGLPDPTNKDMYLLDLRVNPGNSGGPLCDSLGNVVGMITAKFDGGGGDDSYGFAIPAADLVKFLDQHLPAGTPRASPSSAAKPLTWRQVSDQVKSGVLMVLNKKK